MCVCNCVCVCVCVTSYQIEDWAHPEPAVNLSAPPPAWREARDHHASLSHGPDGGLHHVHSWYTHAHTHNSGSIRKAFLKCPLSHSLPPLFSFFLSDMVTCPDGRGLHLLARLSLVGRAELEGVSGLPNHHHSSDHLPLLARFRLWCWAGAPLSGRFCGTSGWTNLSFIIDGF